MRITLGSHNPSKKEEILPLFAGTGIHLQTLDEAGIRGEAVEDAPNLRDNALKKAHFVHTLIGGWSIADDTGIFITALDNAPGVHSARWAGVGRSTEEITAFTLERMEGKRDRSAEFKTVVAIIDPSGMPYTYYGSLWGHLLLEAPVPARPKQPYSPIFVPRGYDQPLAAMDLELINMISHRSQAFLKARDFLLTRL